MRTFYELWRCRGKKAIKGDLMVLMRILSAETNLPCVSVKCVFLCSYLFFGSLNFAVWCLGLIGTCEGYEVFWGSNSVLDHMVNPGGAKAVFRKEMEKKCVVSCLLCECVWNMNRVNMCAYMQMQIYTTLYPFCLLYFPHWPNAISLSAEWPPACQTKLMKWRFVNCLKWLHLWFGFCSIALWGLARLSEGRHTIV